ncbi:MAG: protein kinase [Myxococcales bacterium]
MTATAQIRDPLVGSRIDGRYLIRGVLGRGGMGVVYDGLHEQLGRPVAIKVLGAGLVTEPSSIERFLREARTASSLTHGNIVDVTDLGELPDGRPYLVMPKMNGQDLLSMLREKGPQSPTRVVELLRGAASALDVIHAKGLVHRDVKPENLMHVVHDDGSESVRLLDFGIVALTKQDQRLTAEGVVFGTPVYLAPEIMDCDEPDARADVYSLAVVAFELLTGRAPFEANTSIRIMQMKTSLDAPTMEAICGLQFGKQIEEVVGRGLQRDPKKRFASAGEFVRALDGATRGASDPALGIDLDQRGKALSSRIGALPTLDGPAVFRPDAKTYRATLAERLARRRGLLIAACVGPLVGAALAWGFPDSDGEVPHGRASAAHQVPQLPEPVLPAPSHAPEPAQPADPVPIVRVMDIAELEREQGLTKVPTRAPRKAAPRSDKPANTNASPGASVPAVSAPSAPPVANPSNGAAGADLVKAAAQALVMGQLDLADKLYTDATRKEPNNAAAWRGLGLTSERLGRREVAISAFQRSLQIAPTGAQADSIRARLSKLTGS